MPRIARAVAIGFPHHITQRGNYRQTVFENGADYLQYLQWLKEYSEKYSLKIWAYCLMSNHVHFIAVPAEQDSMARTFNMLHMRYSQYGNAKQEAAGHLWQGRFFSCVLDERHLYAGVRYVENNPVEARMVKKAEQYKWSSARSHVLGEADAVLSKDCYLVKSITDWAAYLREKEKPDEVEQIRKNTRTGRPCGDAAFGRKIEEIVGRRLIALPHGRPKKK
jgi:putative transposase